MKNRFQNLPFKFQLAALQRGMGKGQAPSRSVSAGTGNMHGVPAVPGLVEFDLHAFERDFELIDMVGLHKLSPVNSYSLKGARCQPSSLSVSSPCFQAGWFLASKPLLPSLCFQANRLQAFAFSHSLFVPVRRGGAGGGAAGGRHMQRAGPTVGEDPRWGSAG
jgi:hypothetical protein